MILFQDIELTPTAFTLDVWVSDDIESVMEAFENMYNLRADLQLNEVSTIRTGSKTIFEGTKRIYMLLEGFDPAIMAHEVNHVLWHLSDCSGVEITRDSQEWQSCMIETIMEKCLDTKNYARYD